MGSMSVSLAAEAFFGTCAIWAVWARNLCAVRNREAGLDRASLGSGYRAYLKSTGSQGTVSPKGRGACAGTCTWAIR